MRWRGVEDRPIKTKVLIYFLPIILLAVILTGVSSYIASVSQLKKNAYSLLNDTLYQTNIFLNDKFTTVLSDLVAIENTNAYKNIVSDPNGNTGSYPAYDDVIGLNKAFEDAYTNHFQMIDSIYLTLNNGREFDLHKDMITRRVGIRLPEWMAAYSGKESSYFWLNSHSDHVFESSQQREVMSLFKVIGGTSTPVHGILLFNLRADYFLSIMRNVKVSPNGYMALVSPDGSTIYSKATQAGNEIRQEGIDFLKDHSGSNGSFNVKNKSGQQMIVMFNTLGATKWALAAIVPEQDMIQKAGQIKYISASIIIALVILFTVMATLFAGSISRSIQYLSRQVRRFEQGDYSVQFSISDKNEIGVLSRGLSSLLETVTSLLQQLRKEQEKKRQMELLALQAQITPHFLYNTLGSIKHLIDLKENDRASKMVGALSKFFMITISRGKELITVKEELEHIRNYLTIQKMRYSKEFEYEIDVDPELLSCPIIKLTLQPIVENSIYHGIKNKAGLNCLRITGWKEEGLIMLEVYDDGAGIAPERLAQLRASISLEEVEDTPITYGLRSAHQRLTLHFGNDYGLRLESQEGVYTKVRIVIPFTYYGEES